MLSGSLDAFALPDVFSLLAATKKTGTLHIRTPRGDGWLEFRAGEVAYAVSDTRRMALASRLLGGGLVDDAQLRRIVAAQRGGASALTSALLDQKVVDEASFDELVREQIQDAVFELMRQSEGSFSFDAAVPGDGEDAEGAVRVSVSTDQLVSEGDRRLRDWAQIAGQIVSFDAIVTLAPQPPAEAVDVKMDKERWRLLTFVDGRRTVRDLVDLTGLGEYAASQVVASLIRSGLVEVVDPSGGGRTGVAELVARHELLHRLEERELAAGSAGGPAPSRPVLEEPVERTPPPIPEPEPEPEPVSVLTDEPEVEADEPEVEDPEPEQQEPEALEPLAEEDGEVVGYREDEPPRRNRDITEDEAFDREEVERELASLGYRRLPPGEEEAEEVAPSPFRVNRAEDMNRGLLNRLIDIRKQP